MSQNQTTPSIPLSKKIEIMQALSLYPALTILIFCRRGLGYRVLKPLHLFGMAFVMLMVSGILANSPHPEWLRGFAAVMLALGLWKRLETWRKFRRGVQQHSYYIGDSVLDFNWLPRFVRRNRRVSRFLDPLAGLVIGAIMLNFSPALGKWLLFSSLSLRVLEDAVHRKQLDREMDTIDGLITAQVQAETVTHFSEPAAVQKNASDFSQGIPTGIGPDIQKRIEERLRAVKRRP